MKCPYCKKDAIWTSNDVVYGRKYGKSFMCYYCKDCDAYVGCHNNTKNPLGTMANKVLRKKRMEAHAVIDPIWKNKQRSRGKVYQMLSDAMGIKYLHIGSADEKLCEDIIKTTKILFN